jgi:hypothetical protein
MDVLIKLEVMMAFKRLLLAALIMLHMGGLFCVDATTRHGTYGQIVRNAPKQCVIACKDFSYYFRSDLNATHHPEALNKAISGLLEYIHATKKMKEGLDIFDRYLLPNNNDDIGRVYMTLLALDELKPLTEKAQTCLECAEKLQAQKEKTSKFADNALPNMSNEEKEQFMQDVQREQAKLMSGGN